MPILLFATHNPWKTQLFQPVFCAYGFDLLMLSDLALEEASPPETGATVVEIALAKARAYHSPAYPWVFGDDAGLEIDALNGEPGVKARRWGGRFSDRVSDEEWLAYLLDRMRDIPLERRTARFTTGWALIDPAGKAHTRVVYWPFTIALAPVRPMLPGSPVGSVRLGPEDDLGHRRVEIRREFERWGVFERTGLLPLEK